MRGIDHHHKDRPPVLAEYAALSRNYDSRWSSYIEATHRATLARLHLSGNERILDVGCGTGMLLETLSAGHPGLRLAGIDPSSEMLEVARRRLKPEVALELAWAEWLPYTDETFDVLVSSNIFHYIREPSLALTEALRVLKPGGLFLITDWCHDFLTCRVCDACLRVFNRAHFKTYRQKECREMLSASGFRDIKIERYKINWLWGLMTVTSYKPAQSRSAQDNAML